MRDRECSQEFLGQFLHLLKRNRLSFLTLHENIVDWRIVGALIEQILQVSIMESFLCLWWPGRILDDESQISIYLLSDDCNFELHDVHGECPCFICKNILYLS